MRPNPPWPIWLPSLQAFPSVSFRIMSFGRGTGSLYLPLSLGGIVPWREGTKPKKKVNFCQKKQNPSMLFAPLAPSRGTSAPRPPRAVPSGPFSGAAGGPAPSPRPPLQRPAGRNQIPGRSRPHRPLLPHPPPQGPRGLPATNFPAEKFLQSGPSRRAPARRRRRKRLLSARGQPRGGAGSGAGSGAAGRDGSPWAARWGAGRARAVSRLQRPLAQRRSPQRETQKF